MRYTQQLSDLDLCESSIDAGAVAIHRMRRRYDELLRDEIAQPVASPEEEEAEFAYLLQMLARG